MALYTCKYDDDDYYYYYVKQHWRCAWSKFIAFK